MNQLLVNFRVRVSSDQPIQLNRYLPGSAGKINVEIGQEVSPVDILGQGSTSAGFRTVNLTRELKVAPEKARLYLKRNLGQTIYEGELLALKEEAFGFKKKFLLSPVDGIIDFYDEQTGNLKIKLLPKVSKLVSGVWGVVEAIDKTLGAVTIRSFGSLIYGVFGCGKEREGVLKIVGSAEELVSSRQIIQQMHKRIVVGGSLIFLDALEKAVSIGVVGIISGGVNATDYKAMMGGEWNIYQKKWSDVGLSLLVTEGFGSLPIGNDIFSVLQKYHNRFAVLDGNQARLILPSNDRGSMMYIRKMKMPVMRSLGIEPPVGLIDLKAGETVRIVSPPDLSRQGRVEAIDQTLTTLPSGLVSLMVTVVTSKRKLRVPYQNLEVIR